MLDKRGMVLELGDEVAFTISKSFRGNSPIMIGEIVDFGSNIVTVRTLESGTFINKRPRSLVKCYTK